MDNECGYFFIWKGHKKDEEDMEEVPTKDEVPLANM